MHLLTFQQATVDKHFAPDVVIEAIGNSLASTDGDERRAAIVLAATQRPNPISKKAKLSDAPEVYTDASGKPRVRYSLCLPAKQHISEDIQKHLRRLG